MARGVRKSIEEKIAEKEEVIQALQVRIKSEKAELEGMYREKRDKDLEKLSQVLEESGLTPEDAAGILQEHVNTMQYENMQHEEEKTA